MFVWLCAIVRIVWMEQKILHRRSIKNILIFLTVKPLKYKTGQSHSHNLSPLRGIASLSPYLIFGNRFLKILISHSKDLSDRFKTLELGAASRDVIHSRPLWRHCYATHSSSHPCLSISDELDMKLFSRLRKTSQALKRQKLEIVVIFKEVNHWLRGKSFFIVSISLWWHIVLR